MKREEREVGLGKERQRGEAHIDNGCVCWGRGGWGFVDNNFSADFSKIFLSYSL